MENKENKYQIILLASVIVCAIFTFVTIAWAAFSTTLKIQGTATIKAQTWNVYWSAASVDHSTGATDAIASSIDSIGTATNVVTLSSLSADFNTPGQKVVYNMTITNGGTFDAKFVQFTAPTISCKGASDSAYVTQANAESQADIIAAGASSIAGKTSAQKICNFITWELKTKNPFTSITNSGGITAGTTFSGLANTLVLDKTTSTGAIASGGSIDLELTIYFDKEEKIPPASLPTEEISVKYETFEAKFDQA
jgi:hypothetical protein